jgi:V8-like Glu-specific endopeptidase
MAIQGDDGRVAITTNAGATPFSAYVQVAAKFSDGAVVQSSGLMVGPNDVLTLGDAIFSSAHGGAATQIQVTPGRYLDQKPFGVFDASTISATVEWQNNSTLTDDYGLISLGNDIGYVTGWVEMGYVSTPSTLTDYTLSTVGYPTDQGGNTLYYSSGTVDQVVENVLYFSDDLDVMPGQSGSPVVINSAGVDVVLGLVSQATETSIQNRVLALSSASAQNIQTWSANNSEEMVLDGLNPSFSSVSNTTDLQIVRMIELLFDQQPGYAVLESYRKVANEQGVEAAAAVMIQSQSQFSEDAFVINQIIANTQMTGDVAVVAEGALNNLLTAAATEAARGKAVLDAGSILAGLTGNAVFGSYAVAFNTEVTNSLAYSVVPMHSDARTVDVAVSGSVLQSTDWMLL